MTTQFYCKNKDRWKKVRDSNTINGIDYLEISSDAQTTLSLYFLHDLPGEPGGIPGSPPDSPPHSPPDDNILTKEKIFIEGGVRVKNIIVKDIYPDVTQKNLLTVIIDKTGDFSTYTLKIGNSQTDPDNPPAGFDMQLSSIEFSFKINCPSEFDCKTEIICPPEDTESPNGNYLVKDYSSFNRMMLDRLSIIMPDWNERNAADLQIALIELLAYIGDHLSYYQDAVATEAYLKTARRRISLKRHARLLDYAVHDGCNARVWVQIEVEPGGNAEGLSIEKGTILMTNSIEGKTSITELEKSKFLLERDPVVFETMHKIILHSAHNRISFYTWEDTDCCLPMGSTQATLLDEPALSLQKGDVLIFEELYSPETGKKADKNLNHRHAVRLKTIEKGIDDSLTGTKIMNIEWYEQDALPFSLCLTSSKENEDNAIALNEKSIARGNVVLADHGLTQKGVELIPAAATDKENYYPRLPDNNITVAVPYDHSFGKNNASNLSIIQDPHKALPAVCLVEVNDQDSWTAQGDLLGSDRFACEFVVETEQDGTSFIRFGNDILGRKPSNGFEPSAIYRIGNGKEGNIGAEAINTIVLDGGGIKKIRNPKAAKGAMNPETMEEVRQFAPQAFRTQERAVTESDYVSKTELHSDVQKVAAKFYWTGSWYTVYIIIDRIGGKEINEEFKQEIIKHLEKYRMAGYDLEIRAPRFVPLSIILNVCVKSGYFRSSVKQSLLEAFASYDLIDGTHGFFHPDNFSFGQAVFLSSIYKRAMDVQGIDSIEVKEFKRWAKKSNQEIEDGLLQPSELEILRLDNDPNFPENGKIDFIMFGGL